MNTLQRKGIVKEPNLSVLVKGLPGVPMDEALAKACEADATLAPNSRFSRALARSEEWQSIRERIACWTGTMVAYEKPGVKIGRDIDYTDPITRTRYVFEVPGNYRGMADVALVAEHPCVELGQDGKDLIVIATSIGIVERFPASEGWYLGDPKYDIPSGVGTDIKNPNARRLCRGEKRVGLAVRIYDSLTQDGNFDFTVLDDVRRYIYLNDKPSICYGAIIETVRF
jgi:hypothetical protein